MAKILDLSLLGNLKCAALEICQHESKRGLPSQLEDEIVLVMTTAGKCNVNTEPYEPSSSLRITYFKIMFILKYWPIQESADNGALL